MNLGNARVSRVGDRVPPFQNYLIPRVVVAITFSVPRPKMPAQLRRSDALKLTTRAVRTHPDFRIQIYLQGSVALRGCVVAPSAARYSRNWTSSLREPSAFAVCSVSLA